MGNCMARKAVVVGEPEKKNEAPREDGKSGLECGKSSTMKQKKTVRFRVDGEGEEERRKGVVRIRLVVTREELRQILNGESPSSSSSSAYSCSEELLAAIKIGSRRSSRIRMVDDHQPFSSSDRDMKSRKWRPVLESIPEF